MSSLDAMGLGYYNPGQNAFQACVPRAVPRPPVVISPELQAQRDRKNATYHRTMAQKAADSLRTEGERKAARLAREKDILTDNTASPFCTAIATPEQSDRTRALRGRAL